jgi:hypothetical protein
MSWDLSPGVILTGAVKKEEGRQYGVPLLFDCQINVFI